MELLHMEIPMSAIAFSLPDALVAREPPERRGLPRDRVRLLVLDRATGVRHHARFDALGHFLRPGDLLVVNASRTLPAVLDARPAGGGPPAEVRLAGRRPDGAWRALVTAPDGREFAFPLHPGLRLRFGPGLSGTLGPRDPRVPRLWAVRFDRSGADLLDRLYRLGRPVRYEYVAAPWPLDDYQTVYARAPGSAEMPSAGRAFTWRVLFGLRRQGVGFASIVLHTGLSSYLDDDLDARHLVPEEEYHVGPEAAAAVNAARERGGRVVAVGTTVVRALETAADEDGRVRPGHDVTRLRITAETPLRATDGLLTGLHEPEASHLDLLTAFAPAEVIQGAYGEAVERGYLWHEFGDLNLIL
jgi:S-adenosylmethionine:tRNA ribosyltransferase-isomerase